MAEPEKKPAPAPAPAPAAAGGAPAAAAKAEAAPAKEGDPHAVAAADPHGAPAAGGGGGNKVVMIVFVSLIILLPVIGFVVAKMALAPMIAEKRAAADEEDLPIDDGHGAPAAHGEAKKEDKGHGDKPADKGHGDKKEAKGGGHGEEKGKKAEPGGTFIPEIVVNIYKTRGTRFLRATFQFEASPEAITEMETKAGQMRDIVSTILASKTLEQLEGGDVRQRLRQEVMTVINLELKAEKKVTNVFITDFVIQ